jgi:hypothetical protein
VRGDGFHGTDTIQILLHRQFIIAHADEKQINVVGFGFPGHITPIHEDGERGIQLP